MTLLRKVLAAANGTTRGSHLHSPYALPVVPFKEAKGGCNRLCSVMHGSRSVVVVK